MIGGLRVGQVAAAAGVNRQTLRYYERRGLVPEPDRTLGGHRVYPPKAVNLIRGIKTAQRLGFTLDEVAELLALGGHGRRGRHQDHGMRASATAKLDQIESKIAHLASVRDTLRQAVAEGCDDLVTCAQTPACPLSEAPANTGRG